jgi:molecular chaperone GrpE
MKCEIKLKEIEKKCEEYLNGWKRSQADYQNLKRENEDKIKKISEISLINFSEKLLPIIDNFDLALEHVPEDQKNNDWVKGILNIKKFFDSIILDLGIKRIDSIGKQFDPNFHEALEMRNAKNPEGEIIDEVQSGYILGRKLIRPSKVVVSKGEKNN